MGVPEGLPPSLTDHLGKFDVFINDEMDRTGGEAEHAGPPANTIYHYTDVKGALGILESGRFWLTERAHLNDPSEIKHGLGMAVGIVENLEAASPTVLRHLSTRLLKDGLDKAVLYFGFYVASFSFDPDDLGQWRAYSEEGRGVALGFSSSAFEKVAPNQPDPGVLNTFAVRYDERLLGEYQQRGIECALDLLETAELRGDFSRNQRIVVPWIFARLGVLLVWNSVMFKHPAYGHEREFRILLVGERETFSTHPWHRVRERNGEIVDYHERPFHPGISSPGVLTHIRVGPAAPEKLVAQLRGTVRSLGIPDPVIDRSSIPFRVVG